MTTAAIKQARTAKCSGPLEIKVALLASVKKEIKALIETQAKLQDDVQKFMNKTDAEELYSRDSERLLVTWYGHEDKVFDKKAFTKAHPRLNKLFTKTVMRYTFLVK